MTNCLLASQLAVATLLLLSRVQCGWIDPDTPISNKISNSYDDGSEIHLVFSDEFNIENRQFFDGYDPKWTAIEKDDYTNAALQYYNASLVKTKNGMLEITSIAEDIDYEVFDSKLPKPYQRTKHYQSAMLQGWNKFCFTGGVVEISAQLPGHYEIGGLWPALWLLGNLARATYVGTSNNIWPWSFDICDTKLQHQQLISACNIVNHYRLHSKQGRGAPEIDILEAMPGLEDLQNTDTKRPYYSASLQVAPGNRDYRPTTNSWPVSGMWYEDGLQYGENTSLNIFFYGMFLDGETPEKSYLTDAISANRNLNESHFTQQHTYRIEWEPGSEGYLSWYLDGEFVYRIDADALNLTQTLIPEEPMYLILNTAISSTWGFPSPCPEGCPCDCYDCRRTECFCAIPPNMCNNFPATMKIDYIRVYQKDKPGHIVGCSTPTHPTKKFIEAHASLYAAANTFPIKRSDNRLDSNTNDDSLDENDKNTNDDVTKSYLRHLYSNQPLKEIPHGHGKCKHDNDCGYHNGLGFCDKYTKRCVCKQVKTPMGDVVLGSWNALLSSSNDTHSSKKHHTHGVTVNQTKILFQNNQIYRSIDFTGPHCIAMKGFDDIDWEKEDNLAFYYMNIPHALFYLVAVLVLLLLLTVVNQYRYYQKLVNSHNQPKSMELSSRHTNEEQQPLLTDNDNNNMNGSNFLATLSPETRRNLLSSNTTTFTALNIGSDYTNYQSLSPSTGNDTSNVNTPRLDMASTITPRPYHQ